MSDTTDHAAAIKDQAQKLAEGNIWAVDSYIAEIERHVDALQAERDYHRDDAAMVRRERDAEAKRLAAALAEAEAQAALQLDRAERLAQTILGLCEGDANDLEFELDLYPLDLYDQTGGEFVVPTNREAAAGRTARLRKALRIVAAIADERGKRLSPYYTVTLGEDAQAEMGLHPGDLPDAREDEA